MKGFSIFLKDVEGQVAISNRIFEIWFYNLFIAEEAINSKTYDAGERDKNQFVSKDRLNMDLVLKKFVQHFEESFGNSTDSFIFPGNEPCLIRAKEQDHAGNIHRIADTARRPYSPADDPAEADEEASRSLIMCCSVIRIVTTVS